MGEKPRSFKDAPTDIREAATKIVKSYGFDMGVMAGAIGAAILAERERCAKIAENAPGVIGLFADGSRACDPDSIAAAIRTPSTDRET